MTLTHRRTDDRIPEGWVILFAEEGNEHYGNHVWELRTELPSITSELIEWTADYYDIDDEESKNLLDPNDIVNDAGAWDDPQFVSDLWQAMEYGELEEQPGFRTTDGAAVIDRESVDLRYHLDSEED